MRMNLRANRSARSLQPEARLSLGCGSSHNPTHHAGARKRNAGVASLLFSAYMVCSSMGAPIPQSWLKALEEVESNGNPRAVGRHGEMTKFQVMPSVWREYNNKPIHRCGPNEIAATVKEIWSDRVDAFTLRHGRKPTAAELYLIWHRPARATRPTKVERERAVRFSNLVAP